MRTAASFWLFSAAWADLEIWVFDLRVLWLADQGTPKAWASFASEAPIRCGLKLITEFKAWTIHVEHSQIPPVIHNFYANDPIFHVSSQCMIHSEHAWLFMAVHILGCHARMICQFDFPAPCWVTLLQCMPRKLWGCILLVTLLGYQEKPHNAWTECIKIWWIMGFFLSASLPLSVCCNLT